MRAFRSKENQSTSETKKNSALEDPELTNQKEMFYLLKCMMSKVDEINHQMNHANGKIDNLSQQIVSMQD